MKDKDKIMFFGCLASITVSLVPSNTVSLVLPPCTRLPWLCMQWTNHCLVPILYLHRKTLVFGQDSVCPSCMLCKPSIQAK